MIPATVGFLDQDFEIEEPVSRTYKMDLTGNSIRGFIDELEAVKQAIFMMLNTERYKYVIYSWDYGVEFEDLFGQPISYVCPELERRITEALTQDSRIEDVTDFEFDLAEKGVVGVTFIVHTIFGDVQEEKAVNY